MPRRKNITTPVVTAQTAAKAAQAKADQAQVEAAEKAVEATKAAKDAAEKRTAAIAEAKKTERVNALKAKKGYILLIGNVKALEIDVNEHLAAGFELVGGVSVVAGGAFAQSIIRT